MSKIEEIISLEKCLDETPLIYIFGFNESTNIR